MLDIHAHILPGVDDGATDDAEAVEMLKAAHRAGIDRIVATPHVSNSNKIARIKSTYNRFRYVAQEHGITLIQGCELSVGVLAGIEITSEFLEPFAIGKTKFVLLEFSDNVPPVDWEYLVSDIKRVGFHAIIAHPERYRYIAKDIFIARELLNYGCELQLDALSFLSRKFSTERRAAVKLLESGLISYIASDAHCAKDYVSFGVVQRLLDQKWPTDGLLKKLT
jgi:protein-tyrosine phosphatase